MRAKLVIAFAVLMTLFSMITGIKIGKKKSESEE